MSKIKLVVSPSENQAGEMKEVSQFYILLKIVTPPYMIQINKIKNDHFQTVTENS